MPMFNTANKAPGVYIQEIQQLGPIAGASTSTAAFVGPANMGPVNKPTMITSWSQFVATFGTTDPKGTPHIGAPRVFASHAVQGFFENGGSLCYFVRASRSKQAALTLKDRSAPPGFDTLMLTAKTAGAAGGATTVTVADANIVNAVPAHRESVALVAPGAANFTANVSAADAAKFFPGDTVLLASAANSERNVIDTIAGGVVTLKGALANAYAAADTMRLADLEPGQTRVRLDDVANIEPATVLTITNGAATESVAVEAVNKTTKTVTVAPLQNTYAMAAADPAVTATSQEFGLTITAGATTEHYTNLSMDPRHSRYYAPPLTQSALVTVTPAYPASPSRPPDNRPAVLAATNLAGGADENYAAIDANDYKASIDALKKLDDVNILCVPDRFDADVQQYMIDHCTQMADRFAVLDPRPAAEPADILTQRGTVASDLGFGALYYPRIMIGNPDGPGRIAVPPSGHIAGLFARTDDNPGVHKAPANEQLRGALDLERPITAEEQGPLNEQQVNCIRLFKGRGVVVFGARTLSTDTPWRYVSTRRLLLFIEQSLARGTRFVVFQPNRVGLWEAVKRTVAEFLTRVWKSGALVGAAPEEGYLVQVDEELNPPAQVALGILTIKVTVYPAPPAEYVVFQIIQQPGGPLIKE